MVFTSRSFVPYYAARSWQGRQINFKIGGSMFKRSSLCYKLRSCIIVFLHCGLSLIFFPATPIFQNVNKRDKMTLSNFLGNQQLFLYRKSTSSVVSSYCNWIRTQNHLVRKRTLNQFGQMVECSFTN